ncbi:hypothetical protein [Pseudonocardia lacus]|uniref:hypothetical protein n=1 Tax=Pseudonocardia lacus TaxID=2835865 RepID=UPI001BDC09B8|nr:hypothetical protein [Pseudonocardia lacus]
MGELAGRVHPDHPPEVQHRDAVGDPEDVVQVVRNDKHGQTPVGQPADLGEHDLGPGPWTAARCCPPSAGPLDVLTDVARRVLAVAGFARYPAER